MMSDLFTVAFFGHRYIEGMLWVEDTLQAQIENILREHAQVMFLVGRNGEFDQCAASSVRRAMRKFPDTMSELILVLPYMTSDFRNNEESFLRYYTSVYISPNAQKAHPKSAFSIRNREMVDRADMILCYITQKSGGAYNTLQYAKKCEKAIINVAEIPRR